MWGELDSDFFAGGDGKFLFDLRKVPMLRDGVRANTFVAFNEEIIELGFASGAADAAKGIRNDPGSFHDAGFEQRNGGQQNAGWVTARRSNQGSLFDLGAMGLRQSIHGVLQQAGCGMVMAVKLLINGGVFDAKI